MAFSSDEAGFGRVAEEATGYQWSMRLLGRGDSSLGSSALSGSVVAVGEGDCFESYCKALESGSPQFILSIV